MCGLKKLRRKSRLENTESGNVIAESTVKKERRRIKDAWALKTPENGSIVARERRTIETGLSKTDFYTNSLIQEPFLQIYSLLNVFQWVTLLVTSPLGLGVST
jgi:hypothetical protein